MGKEKKEIGKLLELLNEYDPYIASDGEHKPNLWGYAYQGHSAVFPKELSESYIISARYGFIGWLVENDKIDKSKVFSFIDTADKPYEDILCLLALSDEPIEDLISFLK